jgi:hypothetical protein
MNNRNVTEKPGLDKLDRAPAEKIREFQEKKLAEQAALVDALFLLIILRALLSISDQKFEVIGEISRVRAGIMAHRRQIEHYDKVINHQQEVSPDE